jgi:peptidoglycan/xylan/chitin deacetylase (PgdA/CDA1 family)
MRNPSTVSAARIVKFAISLAVFAVSEAATFMSRLLGRKQPGTCVVLYYHSIPEDQRARFANQLDAILRCAKPVGLNGRVVLAKGEHCAAITFDDGFENFSLNAVPELQKRGIPATMFVISAAIGKAFGPANRSEKVMSLQQIQALPEDLVTIGSHTSTHPLLPAVTEENALRELVESRTELEKMLDREIPLFSFPFGGFNERLVALCRQAGYQRVFTTLPYFAFANPDEFVVGRVRVDPTDWPLEFRLKVAGAYRWLPLAFVWRRRILTNGISRVARGPRSASPEKAVPQSMIREWSGR